MIACFSGFLWKFMAAVPGILGGMYPVLAWAHTELSMLLKHVYGCPVVPTAMCSKQGGVWNLITELLPCWVFDLKSKIVFSSLRVGYVRSGCSPEAFQRIWSVAWAQLELATPPKTYLWFHQLPLP